MKKATFLSSTSTAMAVAVLMFSAWPVAPAKADACSNYVSQWISQNQSYIQQQGNCVLQGSAWHWGGDVWANNAQTSYTAGYSYRNNLLACKAINPKFNCFTTTYVPYPGTSYCYTGSQGSEIGEVSGNATCGILSN